MRSYTILKGQHGAKGVKLPMLRLGGTASLKFRIKFSTGCCKAVDGVDRYDFSKASGIGVGDHRVESVRLGWRGTGKTVELAGFFHVDSAFVPDIRGEKLLGSVRAGEWVEVSVAVRKESLFISCLGKALRVPRGKERALLPICYLTNLWYGGNRPAPTDCQVDVELLHFGR